MRGEAWQGVFRTAGDRCSELGRRDLMRVTPHMMRHTFAVNLLEQLERERLKNASPMGGIREIDMISSMTEVQRRLGHTSPTTTAIYLHEVKGRIDGGQDAYQAWFSEVEGEEV